MLAMSNTNTMTCNNLSVQNYTCSFTQTKNMLFKPKIVPKVEF